MQVVRSMITPRRLSRMPTVKLTMAEALQWLCRAEPTSKDMIEALHSWTAKTPARAALLQARTKLQLGLCHCHSPHRVLVSCKLVSFHLQVLKQITADCEVLHLSFSNKL